MIAALLQARSSSRRLPGKVLADLVGKPMIHRQLERLARIDGVDRLVVATSTEASDDELAASVEGAGFGVYRGDLEDVLGRMVAAGRGAEHVIRLTADCPLADPELIGEILREHVDGGYDYTSNTQVRTYPEGLDAEVVRMSALELADREAETAFQREHVTPFLYQHPERFQLGSVVGEADLSHLRWTVDEPPDLEFVRRVYAALYPVNERFTTADVLALLEAQPELSRINADIVTRRDPERGDAP